MNTPKSFDPNKPVQTRDGRKARILCTDRKAPKDEENLIALVTYEEASIEHHHFYFSNGSYNKCGQSKLDLINIPEKHTIERWLVVFYNERTELWNIHPTTATIRDYCGGIKAIKKLTIEYTEGEGLE